MDEIERALGEDARILARLGLAMLLAAVVGWEREVRPRPAGLRTHCLVAMSAALLVSVAEPLVAFIDPAGTSTYDPIRVSVAVMTGVAFLGAGTIFVHDRDGGVRGVTTAASLFATAGIGIAVGIERLALAVGATALLAFVVGVLGWMERRLDD